MTPGARKLFDALKSCTESRAIRRIVKRLDGEILEDLIDDWPQWGRKDQTPPAPGNWEVWLVLGGRGAGKTRTGAEWVKARVKGNFDQGLKPAGRIALVAPTLAEARHVMVEGKSGLMSVYEYNEPEWRPHYEPSKRLLTWPNGAVAQIFSAEEPDSLRGPQFDLAWCDELAKWKHAEAVFDMLKFSMRLSERPLTLISTTPRPIPLIKRMLADPAVGVTRAATFANAKNLAPSFLRDVVRRYGGTRLGRQELDGEIIADDPDALFKRDWIEAARVRSVPELRRIVVAVDPPAGQGRGSRCGIIAAGLGRDGRCYVLEDKSVARRSPAQWAARVAALYRRREACRVVAEVNQGGAMVEAVLREVDPGIAVRSVYAARGKTARAEPVAALYEQGRVAHVGAFPELEDELCGWTGAAGQSPDRLDALVWAVSDLMLRPKQAEPRVRVI
ncbi:MAG: DNA-packaging protein [Rhizobiales bacterium]|nr:DNA-packaging protein [Hyphomicrobiales bacterium]